MLHWGAPVMNNSEATLGELIATFQLRRRASPDAFHEGVRLSDSGAVDIIDQTERYARVEVLDAVLETVTVRAERGAIAGDCSCVAGGSAVCRHQVAAAHALWNLPSAD